MINDTHTHSEFSVQILSESSTMKNFSSLFKMSISLGTIWWNLIAVKTVLLNIILELSIIDLKLIDRYTHT